MLYIKLFLAFLQVGMFSIGGGYAAIPLIQRQIVEINGWLTMNEFTDLITIAEMTPGPVGVNCSTFVGLRIAGLPGMLIATGGCILPSVIIASCLAFLYYKFRNNGKMNSVLESLRPAVVALIACAGLSIFLNVLFGGNISLSSFSLLNAIIFALAFICLRKTKISPVLIMLGCGGVSLLANVLMKFIA